MRQIKGFPYFKINMIGRPAINVARIKTTKNTKLSTRKV